MLCLQSQFTLGMKDYHVQLNRYLNKTGNGVILNLFHIIISSLKDKRLDCLQHPSPPITGRLIPG